MRPRFAESLHDPYRIATRRAPLESGSAFSSAATAAGVPIRSSDNAACSPSFSSLSSGVSALTITYRRPGRKQGSVR